jgi:hypothetical protein
MGVVPSGISLENQSFVVSKLGEKDKARERVRAC